MANPSYPSKRRGPQQREATSRRSRNSKIVDTGSWIICDKCGTRFYTVQFLCEHGTCGGGKATGGKQLKGKRKTKKKTKIEAHARPIRLLGSSDLLSWQVGNSPLPIYENVNLYSVASLIQFSELKHVFQTKHFGLKDMATWKLLSVVQAIYPGSGTKLKDIPNGMLSTRRTDETLHSLHVSLFGRRSSEYHPVHWLCMKDGMKAITWEQGALCKAGNQRRSSPLDPSSENPFKPYETAFAVVQIGSHQFKVSNGESIFTEKLKYCHINDKLILKMVLMLGSKNETMIGRPVLVDAAVHAVVEEHALDAKVIIFKKKRRKNYRRTKGHRQELTKLRTPTFEG
ncbi:50S ribosomal protein L21 [Carex littledalei]|uniref:Large ribosomal subunit protein bL21m n=1 Tax=Carex littledalei TaxID=544730 RepID=A0A833VIU4_9POAL|nr:50S ribosomal protein L21 [Carex littledalei]